MYHFDYIYAGGGAVFEDSKEGNMITLNGKKYFSFADFIQIFVLIENYKHPFTICTSEKRFKKIDKQLEKMGYSTVTIKQIDFDMGDENAFLYDSYHIDLPNPFKTIAEEVTQ